MIQENETKDLKEYLHLFEVMYQDFVEKAKTQVEDTTADFIIDFDSWNIITNDTGYVNIWVEPKIKLIYRPTYKFPIPEVEIKGLQITIKTKLLDIKPKCKTVSFEVAGCFNPNDWRGRNKLNLHPIGEITTTGINRVVLEQDIVFSTYHTKYVSQNYCSFISRVFDFYFGEKQFVNPFN
jgi:hypothetical protein